MSGAAARTGYLRKKSVITNKKKEKIYVFWKPDHNERSDCNKYNV